MELYLPVVVLSAIAGLFAVGSVLMSAVVGPRRYHRVRLESYECGIQPVRDPGGRDRVVPVRYYTLAMSFIVFDIEIMFLVPWAVHFDQLGTFGYVAVLLFILNLTLAYAYEWRRGGLEWD